MIGAIIGDIVGSRFEFNNIKSKDFELFTDECCFTDDTVMTCAVAQSLMDAKKNRSASLQDTAIRDFRAIGQGYPRCGYGAKFINWMYGYMDGPYNSCGNGSAMRISPVGDVAKDIEEAKKMSYDLTVITHNHPEGIKGAEAATVAKVMLENGSSKEEVKRYIEDNYYNLSTTVDEFRKHVDGHGKEICQVTMPQAFACFFEGKDFEDVIRNCISIGGDSDTIAAIAGGIAEAYYEVPQWMKDEAMSYLTYELWDILVRFESSVKQGK